MVDPISHLQSAPVDEHVRNVEGDLKNRGKERIRLLHACKRRGERLAQVTKTGDDDNDIDEGVGDEE